MSSSLSSCWWRVGWFGIKLGNADIFLHYIEFATQFFKCLEGRLTLYAAACCASLIMINTCVFVNK
ncbi:unnamed protein product [Cunninghamella echinulata]